jgi:hypothetical protein
VPSYDRIVEKKSTTERPSPAAAEAEKPVIGPLTRGSTAEPPKGAHAGGSIIKKIIGRWQEEEKKPA